MLVQAGSPPSPYIRRWWVRGRRWGQMTGHESLGARRHILRALSRRFHRLLCTVVIVTDAACSEINRRRAQALAAGARSSARPLPPANSAPRSTPPVARCSQHTNGTHAEPQFASSSLVDHVVLYTSILTYYINCLQCFDAVGWAAGRASGRGLLSCYLSGARCRLACGPADATATHCLLLQ